MSEFHMTSRSLFFRLLILGALGTLLLACGGETSPSLGDDAGDTRDAGELNDAQIPPTDGSVGGPSIGAGTPCEGLQDIDSCESGICVLVRAPSLGTPAEYRCSDTCETDSDCIPGWGCFDIGGKKACSCAIEEEICDGLDNNCDGQVDEAANLCSEHRVCSGSDGCVCSDNVSLCHGGYARWEVSNRDRTPLPDGSDPVTGFRWYIHQYLDENEFLQYHTMSWDEAIALCQSLSHDGQSGWRLPSRMELIDRFSPAGSGAAPLALYWSASPVVKDSLIPDSPDQAWVVGHLVRAENLDSEHRIACVR